MVRLATERRNGLSRVHVTTVNELPRSPVAIRYESLRDADARPVGLRFVPVLHALAEHDYIVPYGAAKPLVANGNLGYREQVVEGLEAAPSAFIGMLEGRNFGKLIVKVTCGLDDLSRTMS